MIGDGTQLLVKALVGTGEVRMDCLLSSGRVSFEVSRRDDASVPLVRQQAYESFQAAHELFQRWSSELNSKVLEDHDRARAAMAAGR